ncbi:TonB-dependent receptor plug domain-containing protein [Sphingomonas turrisvirgatae]|uniref:TonB-dependent receptor n=1 Tax=Sphingomonas turrisvirgatae TaxID=1888892 RepID=A0A1E3LY26_9SPHN|nr:TonB-dependent receptor [Sphingomonas turrisvirgatae]ODP38609.1 TonB-dependent receptor [Sphingomonas turrisvirgatae]
MKFKAALFLSACAIAHPVFAQDASAPATPPEAAQEEPGQSILVTGSRIVRDGYEAPTPLTVLSRAEIENSSPTNNVADFVNQLPQLAGSTKPANSRLNLSSGQAGINALNLRNLGETRTLILVNGRRSVGSAVNGVVDINTIPQALIDRVEVSTGGASSAYGSDAVAGVVNFILDNKYEGLRVTADSGVTGYGDGFNYSGSVAAGKSFAGGRGHILLSAELAHQDGIFNVDTNDRRWNHTGYVRVTNPAWTAGSTTQPQYLTTRRPIGQGNSAPGGLVTASAGTTTNALRGLYFGQNGAVNVFDYGALAPAGFNRVSTVAAPTLIEGGSWQVNDTGRRIGLMPRDDRYGFFGRVSFEVAEGVELFGEASYNRQRIYFNAGPNLQTGISLNATGCGAAATAAAAPLTCNAYLYNTLGPAALTGVTSVTVATSGADLPFRAVDNERRVQRYLIGAEGTFEVFGKAARWDVYGQYGRAELHEELQNIQNTTRLAAATNAVFAPVGNPGGYAAGSIQCSINVNASTTDDDPNCRPVNRLGLGVTDPAAVAYAFGNPYRDETLEQFLAGVNLSVTPFATWAGDVSIAVGAEYRKERIRGFVPAEFQPIVANNVVTNRWSVGNYVPTNGEYDVKEAYLETVIPLGFGLEFNGAVRATDYSASGYVTTWKAGAIWAPIEDIRVRVTRSRDIRAPNLADLYQLAQNTDSVTNPFGAGSGPNGGSYTATGVGYTGTTLGNLNLVPERADSWNIGAVISPRFVPGLSVSVDYFRIELDDAIGTYSAQQIINRCFEGLADFCAQIQQDPNNATRLLFTTRPYNFTTQLVRGIDFEASYRVPVGEDRAVSLRGVATRYIDNIIDTGITGQVPVDTVGANGGQASTPTWIFRGSLSYDSPDFSATLVGRGVSSGKYAASGIECTGTCPVSTTQFPTYDNNRVSGLFYADLNLTQKIRVGESEAQFFVNVTNLFNRWPLLVPETGLAANSTYSDMLGRQFRIGVRFNMN